MACLACSRPVVPTRSVLCDPLSVPETVGRRAGVDSHLGSDMLAQCLTRPQYVLRSNRDSGSSRLPGIEADILSSLPFVLGRGQWSQRRWDSRS
jgi:hypothetical protein